jgi:hypothetical protein
MRASEPYVDDAMWIVDPDYDAISVAGDIEHRAAVLEDADRSNVAFDVRRRGPLGALTCLYHAITGSRASAYVVLWLTA